PSRLPSVCRCLARLPPAATLFPYTTLFRSRRRASAPTARAARGPGRRRGGAVRRGPREGRRRRTTGRAATTPRGRRALPRSGRRSEEHTSELQSRENLVCRLLLEKKKRTTE